MAAQKRWGLAAIVAAALFLTGCGGGSQPGPDSSGAPAGEPQSGGTITIGLLADAVGGLDPHKTPNQQSTWVDGLVYSRLVGLDAEGKIIPDLAEKWEVVSDTEYTFQIRGDVKFHNGRELTADDIKYSLDRLRNPDTGSAKGYWFKSIEEIAAPAPDRITITLSKPDAALLVHLANPVAAVVPQEVVEAEGDLNQKMVGSGPFVFVSHTPGVSLVLKKNPDYFVKGLPYLDEVVLKPLEDENTRVNALKSGDIDVATFVPVNMIDALSKEPGVTVNDGRSGQMYALLMQVGRPPLDNLQVRQAIMNAVDRQALVEGAIFGKGVPLSSGPIPSWHPYHLKGDIYTGSDMKKAERLMKESGVATPINLTMGLWSGQTFAINAGQVIQQELKKLGINIEIKQYGDYASYNKAVFVEKVHDITIQGLGGKIDPDDWLADVFQTGSRSNLTDYSDPAVDALLDEGRATTDAAKRKAAYDKAQKIIAESGPFALLWNMEQPDAIVDRVKNYQHRPDLQLDGLVTTWVEQK